MLIEDFERQYLLGIPQMDDTHREFVELTHQLHTADKSLFKPLFAQLLAHTEAHFAAEDALMHESGFPALGEHTGEHRRVLGELSRLNRKVQGNSILMARAYVSEQLPAWFRLHAVTMDSALAAHLKKPQQDPHPTPCPMP